MLKDILSEEDYVNKRGDYSVILRVCLVFFIANNQIACWHLYNNLAIFVSTIILSIILFYYFKRHKSKPSSVFKDKIKVLFVFTWWLLVAGILVANIFFEHLLSFKTNRLFSLAQDIILFLLCLTYIYGARYEKISRKRISNLLIIAVGVLSSVAFLIELLKWYDVEILNYIITCVYLIWAAAYFLSE